MLENKVKERDIIIYNLKVELEKYYSEDINSVKEIFIADPDKINLELYNELNNIRDVIGKLSKMMNTEKAKCQTYENNIKVLIIVYSGLRTSNKRYEKW